LRRRDLDGASSGVSSFAGSALGLRVAEGEIAVGIGRHPEGCRNRQIEGVRLAVEDVPAFTDGEEIARGRGHRAHAAEHNDAQLPVACRRFVALAGQWLAVLERQVLESEIVDAIGEFAGGISSES